MRGCALGEILIVLRLAFSGFRLGFDGRRPLIRSSFPVWSRSELVNVGFGPKTISIILRLRKRQGITVSKGANA